MSAHGMLGVVVCGRERTAWQLRSASGWAGGAPGQEAPLAMRSPELAAPFQRAAGSRWPRAQASPLPLCPARLRQGPAPGVRLAPGCPRSAAAGNGDPGNPESPRPGPAPERLSPQPSSASREKTAGTLAQGALILLRSHFRVKGRRMEEAGGKRINERHKAGVQ